MSNSDNHYTFGRNKPYIGVAGETLLSCCGHEDLEHWITEDEQGCEKCDCQDRGPWPVQSPLVDDRAEGDIDAYAKWRRDPDRRR